MFDKSTDRFPVRNELVFLNSCGVSPLPQAAADRQISFVQQIAHGGSTVLPKLQPALMKSFRDESAKLMETTPDNITSIRNCAEALSQIALGFPFESGDEIVTYRYEYPSNHFPWAAQQSRGVVLRFVEGTLEDGKPVRWELSELESKLTSRTKLVALSHVQFASGFAVDLEALGKLCRDRGVALVIDAAQSLGAMPLQPERWGIDAIVSSGWKWLLGPQGSGVMYTAPRFREKVAPVLFGPSMTRHGENFLEYSFDFQTDGRKFECSTLPISGIAALDGALQLLNHEGTDAIWQEIQRLQNLFVAHLHTDNLTAINHPQKNRSGILSYISKRPPAEIMKATLEKSIVCSSRGGFLRIAPHFYVSDEEIVRAAEELSKIA